MLRCDALYVVELGLKGSSRKIARYGLVQNQSLIVLQVNLRFDERHRMLTC